MMRLFFLLCFTSLLGLSGQAQERIRNVRMRVVDSTQLEIHYDLINAKPGDSVYLEMRSRLRGTLRILPEFLHGDWGPNIPAGTDRRISWDALANGYSLNEEVQARVFVRTNTGSAVTSTRAEPTPTIVTQTPPATSTTPASVPPKPASTTPVTRSEPKPEITPPVSVTSSPVSSRRPKRTAPPKRSIFAADSVQAESTTPVATTIAPQTPASQTTVVTQRVEPVRTEPANVEPTKVESNTAATNPVASATDTTHRPKTRYAGPAWALLSAVAPGVGNIFVQTPKPKIGLRPLLTVGCYGLVAYGLIERQKSRDEYAIYEQQKNVKDGDPYYQTANEHYHRYWLATRGAALVAAADVILTVIRGVRNNQLQKEAQRYQGIRIRPGFQAGQPTAVLQYNF